MNKHPHVPDASRLLTSNTSRVMLPMANADNNSTSTWEGEPAAGVTEMPPDSTHVCWTYANLAHVTNAPGLTSAARRLLELERVTPVIVEMDRSARCKVGDVCGLACGFCHNEGTPVIPAQRVRGRVSIYEATNGVDFLPGRMVPGEAFANMLKLLRDRLHIREVHWTGGEPTLNPHLTKLTQFATQLGLTVKMTSNGERGDRPLAGLRAAGLQGVNFSIFGTTPAEFAAVQRGFGTGLEFAAARIARLDLAIQHAHKLGLEVGANVVMSNAAHAPRILRLLEKHANAQLRLRILDDLGIGLESIVAIYNLLSSHDAVPVGRHVTAGASGSVVEYHLPNGQMVGFKQIRPTRLPEICQACRYNAPDVCREGYYGVRVYVDQEGAYRVGVCIQRMDLTLPIEDFFKGGLPAAILSLRHAEYAQMADDSSRLQSPSGIGVVGDSDSKLNHTLKFGPV